MRPLIALTTLALALTSPALARQSSDAPRERPDIELLIPYAEILIEALTISNPFVPYTLSMWRFQKLLSRVMFETRTPTWEIDFARTMRSLKYNAEMLRALSPRRDFERTICALCNIPGRK